MNQSCLNPPRTRPAAKARMRTSRGFTLIELLATMAVLVILCTLAGTQFSSTVGNNRAYTAQSELVASLALARSEAMKRGMPVGVSATLPTSNNEFGGGWIVWLDQNGNGSYDAGEQVLRSHEAMPASSVTLSGPSSPITYGAMGFLTVAGTVNVKVCPVSLARKGFGIAIQPNGLADVDPAVACP